MHSTLKTTLESSLSPAPGMDLGFHYDPVSTQLIGCSGSLLRGPRYLPPGIWDRKLIKENLSLILVDIHGAVGADGMSPPRPGQGCMSAQSLLVTPSLRSRSSLLRPVSPAGRRFRPALAP